MLEVPGLPSTSGRAFPHSWKTTDSPNLFGEASRTATGNMPVTNAERSGSCLLVEKEEGYHEWVEGAVQGVTDKLSL